MSSEVRGRCETPSYSFLCCEFPPFNLWRCGRLVCFRLLFAVANNCLCQISDFENKFSVAICQIQQSTIATASLGLLKPAEVVRKSYKYFLLSITRNEFRGKRSLRNALLFFCLCCEFLPFNLLTQQASVRSWAKGSASL